MQKEPLTTAGVQQKLAYLYAQSDNMLHAEATSVRTNFISWLYNNFNINSLQLAYINAMDPAWQQEASSGVALAIENRLPITYTAPSPPPPDGMSKIVELDKQIIVKNDQSSGMVVTGHLAFTVVYLGL